MTISKVFVMDSTCHGGGCSAFIAGSTITGGTVTVRGCGLV